MVIKQTIKCNDPSYCAIVNGALPITYELVDEATAIPNAMAAAINALATAFMNPFLQDGWGFSNRDCSLIAYNGRSRFT